MDSKSQITLLNTLEVLKYSDCSSIKNPLTNNNHLFNKHQPQSQSQSLNPEQDPSFSYKYLPKTYLDLFSHPLNSLNPNSTLNSPNSTILKNQFLSIDNNISNTGYSYRDYNSYGYEKYNSINCLKFDPLDKKLIFATSNGFISSYCRTNNSTSKIGSHQTAVKSMVFSTLISTSTVEGTSQENKSSIMLTGDNNGSVILFNNNLSEFNYKTKIHLHNQSITDLSFSINGNVFASASEDKSVKVYDLEKEKELLCYSEHNSDVKSVDWAKPRSLLVSSGKDKKIRFFDPREKKSIATLSNVHFDIINKVRFNSNSNWFITASKEHNLKLVDFRMLRVLQKFDSHSLGVNSVVWNPLNNLAFCSVGEDKKIIFWHVGSEECHCIDNGHEKEIFDVCYNNFGNVLATGSKDSTIKFWN